MVALREIDVDGFMGIRAKVNLGPGLNVIHAANGAGKTRLLKALALMMQSRGEEWPLIEGHLVIIHEAEDLCGGMDPNAVVGIGIEVELRGDEAMGIDALGPGVTISYSYYFKPLGRWVRQGIGLNGKLVAVVEWSGEEGHLTYPRESRLCIAPTHVMNEDAFIACGDLEEARLAQRLAFALRNALKDRFFLISEDRLGYWKRYLEANVELPRFSVGSEGQYTIHQLAHISSRPDLEGQWAKLLGALRELGIEELKIGLTGSGRISGYAKANGSWFPIYHGGTWLRSTLPIITQLALAPPSSIIAVDGIDLGLDEERLTTLLRIIEEWAREKWIQVIATSRPRPRLGIGQLITLERPHS